MDQQIWRRNSFVQGRKRKWRVLFLLNPKKNNNLSWSGKSKLGDQNRNEERRKCSSFITITNTKKNKLYYGWHFDLFFFNLDSWTLFICYFILAMNVIINLCDKICFYLYAINYVCKVYMSILFGSQTSIL